MSVGAPVKVTRESERWFPSTLGRCGAVADVLPDEGDGVLVMVKFPDADKPYAHFPHELTFL